MVFYYIFLLLLLIVEFIIAIYVFSLMGLVNNAYTQTFSSTGTSAIDKSLIEAATGLTFFFLN